MALMLPSLGKGIGTASPVYGGPGFKHTEMMNNGDIFRPAQRPYDKFKLDEWDSKGPLAALQAELAERDAMMKRGWAVEDRDFGQQADWDKTRLTNAYDLINNIAGKGYIDKNIHGQATKRYDGLNGDYRSAFDMATGLANTGGYSGGADGGIDWSAFESNGPATASAAGIDWGRVSRDYDPQVAALSRFRDVGKYTSDELNTTIANTKAQVNNKYRAGAEATLRGGKGLSGAGAAAFLTRGASESGRAAADARTGLTREQADSRLDGAGMLNSIIAQMMGLTGQEAQMRTDVNIANANNSSRHSDSMNDIRARLLSDQAGNRVSATGMLDSLIGRGQGIADALSGIDLRQMPDFILKLLTDNQKITAQPDAPKIKKPPLYRTV